MFEWELDRAQPLFYLSQIYNAATSSSKIFHLHGSFGDVYIQCALMQELISQGQKVTALIDNKYQQLALLAVNGESRVLSLDSNQAHQLFGRLGILGNSGNYPIRLLPTIYPMITECMAEGHLKYGDFIRTLSRSKSRGRFPNLENLISLKKEALDLISQTNAPIGRSVLISADNNSQLEFTEKFWSDVCDFLYSNGWTPLLNNSGTITLNQASILANSNWPKIKIPPHLAVTITALSGCYIGGTNGFSTIQALFQQHVKGLHLINGQAQVGQHLRDKSGNLVLVDQYPHRNSYPKEFLGLQQEIFVESITLTSQLKEVILTLLHDSERNNTISML